MVKLTHKCTINFLTFLLIFSSQLISPSKEAQSKQQKPEGLLKKIWNSVTGDDKTPKTLTAPTSNNRGFNVWEKIEESEEESDDNNDNATQGQEKLFPKSSKEPQKKFASTIFPSATTQSTTKLTSSAAQSKQKETPSDATVARSIALPPQSPTTDDGFVAIERPRSPNFLQQQELPKQSNTFTATADTKQLNETCLAYALRVLSQGKQDEARAKDQDYGVNFSRALLAATKVLADTITQQAIAEQDLLKNQRPDLAKAHNDCDFLAQAINQRCQPCQKSQSTTCMNCTFGSKHITPKHIKDSQDALRAVQIQHFHHAENMIKVLNDRQDALHALRVQMYNAHPTPEQTRPVSPLHRFELVPNPNPSMN